MTDPATRPGRHGGPGTAVSPGGNGPAHGTVVRGPDGRATGLRLARVHLRTGLLLLARAELEALAGRGSLDDDGLVDLAEARWRTGDLARAGEVANALLDRGHDEPLALVIAAEAVAAQGRPGEARRLAGRALEAVEGPLDPLFAGMPRSAIWPSDAAPEPDTGAEAPVDAIGARTVTRHRPAVAAIVPEHDTPASASAAEAFAGGLAALGGGDHALAALRLGVALRLEPGFAEGVLEAIGDRAAEPGLALVAGDALRLLGREAEALAAFDRARGHVPGEP